MYGLDVTRANFSGRTLTLMYGLMYRRGRSRIAFVHHRSVSIETIVSFAFGNRCGLIISMIVGVVQSPVMPWPRYVTSHSVIRHNLETIPQWPHHLTPFFLCIILIILILNNFALALHFSMDES